MRGGVLAREIWPRNLREMDAVPCPPLHLIVCIYTTTQRMPYSPEIPALKRSMGTPWLSTQWNSLPWPGLSSKLAVETAVASFDLVIPASAIAYRDRERVEALDKTHTPPNVELLPRAFVETLVGMGKYINSISLALSSSMALSTKIARRR